ncbi:hypothetical protein [Flavobacterium defluvii]|uniref:HEAT repeat domain-containing protein n=1 Tax=Flavobacterium defluvii TaxID=370979 RepID=A0A1M5URV0_9FLAO|nr:hypothetical protein [Flavobacterium defluvii]SHH65646.1 hypothetical protein SAMN05443663_109134 [Flavobacterium defluvii]
MENVWEPYEKKDWVVPFLIFSIYLFIGGAFVLYLSIVWSRNKKIKRAKLDIKYTEIIERMLSTVVFEDVVFSDFQQDKDLILLFKKTFFRELVMETIINLHKNYDGVYAQKLEQFYKDSGLIKDSFAKLRNLRWEKKCKGITELAEFNIYDAFDSIITFSKVRKKTLKITAINACIKLAGTKGIVHLAEHPNPIDDWTQLNIIGAFKKHDIGDTKGVELLLESKNTTVITLGLKLIRELKLTQKIPYVVQLADRAPNALIKYEAQNVLQTLTV